MNDESSLSQLLRWRQAQAEDAAPPAPRATRLLARVQPWWESTPAHFRVLVDRLSQMQLAYGHAMEERHRSQSGHPVPALIIGLAGEQEVFARLHYFNVRDDRLRLRFRLESEPAPDDSGYEVTFISTAERRPLVSVRATRSTEAEYRLEVELNEDLAAAWNRLKVTDAMPFRFILRPVTTEE